MTASRAPRLSICIPTYNFGPFIGETLDSIVRQSHEGVEVVVLDGGSTDDTAAVVARFADRHPALVYERRAARGGIDRDIEYAVAAARGDYVWLFSADDVMIDGALGKVLERLGQGDDVLLCETILCDLRLGQRREYRMSRERGERSFRLHDRDDREHYLRLAENTQVLFSFCGALIFDRKRWEASPYDGRFVGSCFSHAARLLSLLPEGLRVRLIPEAFSLKRGDNDSFAENGVVNRVRIGIEGYLGLAEHYFGAESVEREQVERLLAAEYTLRHMLAQKLVLHRTGKGGEVAELVRLYERIHRGIAPRDVAALWALRLAPVELLTLARLALRH